jgi:hypothetical protein
MTKIHVRKKRLKAVFSIDVLRTPYFFSDRDPVITNGVKKRIFHIVRAHKRLVGATETYVKTHFRGLRRFVWNGYSVNVTVPGWHHADFAVFDAGAIDCEPGKSRDEMIGMKKLGKRIAELEDA